MFDRNEEDEQYDSEITVMRTRTMLNDQVD